MKWLWKALSRQENVQPVNPPSLPTKAGRIVPVAMIIIPKTSIGSMGKAHFIERIPGAFL